MRKLKPDLSRVLAFYRLLLDFRAVDRTLRLPGKQEQMENDVEHSYMLAMMAWYLAPYFPHLDRDKLIRLSLVHDMVEVHAGDTFAYDAAGSGTKQEREAAALTQLATDWPDFAELTELTEHYEARGSEEAKFVYALDKLMPPLMNVIGKGHNWRAEGITFNDVKTAKASKIAVSPEVNAYYAQLVELLEQHPEFFPAK